MNDEYYMRKALALARRGLGKTSPNPTVGAVIVKNGDIVGQGYHRRFGGPHAEVNAIRDAGGDLTGATLYVTLEPCCHLKKKTPPCLDAILKHAWSRVVVGTPDPNPQVNGRSIAALKRRGIETTVGVLKEECQRLNEAYFKYIRTGMPFITLKFAQTLDGRIASATGDSRWISSSHSLKLAHRLRSLHDAVLVGVDTVLADDPQLTVRLVRGRNPLRVVADSTLKTPLTARVLADQKTAPTVVATTKRAGPGKLSAMKNAGIEVVVVAEEKGGRLDLSDLFRKLGERGISSVLVEGGAGLITSVLRDRLADRLLVIVAPRILGKGIEAVGDLDITDVRHALGLSFVKTFRSGDDLVIEARPRL